MPTDKTIRLKRTRISITDDSIKNTCLQFGEPLYVGNNEGSSTSDTSNNYLIIGDPTSGTSGGSGNVDVDNVPIKDKKVIKTVRRVVNKNISGFNKTFNVADNPIFVRSESDNIDNNTPMGIIAGETTTISTLMNEDATPVYPITYIGAIIDDGLINFQSLLVNKVSIDSNSANAYYPPTLGYDNGGVFVKTGVESVLISDTSNLPPYAQSLAGIINGKVSKDPSSDSSKDLTLGVDSSGLVYVEVSDI